VKVLQQPYPYYYFRANLFRLAATAFTIVFIFLIAFKPFVVNPAEQRMSYWIICGIHAFIPAFVFSVYFFFMDRFLSDTQKDRWSLGTESMHLAILFFLFGVASFLVRDIIYTNPDNWSWYYFSEEVKNTFLGGTLISVILILMNFYRLYSQSQRHAVQINTHLHPLIVNEVHSISVTTNVKADDFVLNLDHFLFARASGNYVELYKKNSSGIAKELKRLTLAQLENQLTPHALRTHRSYLVNVRHINGVSGNAQGYELSFPDTELTAPVSRGNIAAFEAAMK
jgi:LytTr DNA-binding domain